MLKSLFKFLQGFHPPTRCTREISRLLGTGDVSAAASLADRSLRKYPDNTTVIILHAKVHAAQDNHDEVQNSLARILDLKKVPAGLLFDAARMLQLSGDDKKAGQWLNHLDEDRDFWPASNAIGYQKFDDNQFDDAVKFFTRAIAKGAKANWTTVIPAIDQCSNETVVSSREWLLKFTSDEENSAGKYKLLSLFDQKFGDFDSSRRNIRTATAICVSATGQKLPLLEDGPPLPPRFLIIGAMKCGTTTLHELISQHPRFVAPIEKEIQFFQFQSLQESWYLDHFPCLDPSSGYFTGDASPGYYGFDVVERIAELIPDIKVLFIERDPAARAISHVRHNNRLGLSSFGIEAAIVDIDRLEETICLHPEKAEQTLLEITNGNASGNLFQILGLYEILLRRWRKQFGSDQLKVIQLQDLVHSPSEVMHDVFDFLDVEQASVQMMRKNSGDYNRTDETTIRVKARLEKFYERVNRCTTD